MIKCLNLGCGQRFHPEWVNLDLHPSNPSVQRWDVHEELPFPSGSFDVVYHSHVLEHLSKQDAPLFLRECYRVLRSGGVIRVAVPDLEKIARLYLEALEKASQGIPGWAENYEWMLLEMYDQTVRERSFGAFEEYCGQDPIPNWEFVYGRGGAEAKAIREWIRGRRHERPAAPPMSRLSYALRNPAKFLNHKILKVLLSKEDYEALQIGRFRRQGEIHQWMYDGYSLARLLQATGFRNTKRSEATQSQIPNWAQYCLDSEIDGTPYKPDSIYMEAVKS